LRKSTSTRTRRGTVAQVFGRSDNGEALRPAYPHGDHVLREALARRAER
jgi:hypothetical protein